MRPRAALGAALVAATLAASCTGGRDDRSAAPSTAPARMPPASARIGTSSPPSSFAPVSARAEAIPVASLGVSVTVVGDASVSTSGDVSLAVNGPGVAEVRWSLDPDLTEARWQPADGPFTVSFADTGYQMAFLEVRMRDGRVGAAATGILIDPTREASLASDGEGRHRASWVRAAEARVLVVRVETGRVIRDAGAPPRIVGRPIDTDLLDDVAGYALVGGPAIVDLARISRPNDVVVAGDEGTSPMYHDLVLRLDAPLPFGTQHELRFPGDVVEPIRFSIDPDRTRSPAVQVNAVGFRPGDTSKTAYLSMWVPDRTVERPDSPGFRVIRLDNGEAVMDGVATERDDPTARDEWGFGDATGARVWELDFSDLDEPGRYAVCVDGTGCSAPFSIDEASTWRRAAVTVARAAYHQRSGLPLRQPFTSVDRPAPFGQGTAVRRTELSMIEDSGTIGADDRFDEYGPNSTDELIDDAWGGHFDAGDWNNHIQHLWLTLTTLDLVDLFPDVFTDLYLAIPESANTIPDIIDEGLWSLDLFTRLQLPDGGVPGGIDQDRYPDSGETSWDNDVDVFALSPDAWSSYLYAGIAARAAVVLEWYDTDRAVTYADAAEKAMAWAEAQEVPDAAEEQVAVMRATAAAALLRLTGDARWDEVFRASSSFDDGPVDLLGCHDRTLCEAAWAYARVPADLTDDRTRANVEESFVRNAETLVAAQETTAYRWTLEHPEISAVWGLGPSTAHGLGLLRAFVLTGDQAYRRAAQRGASFALGGNPLDMSFVTGLGESNPAAPLLTDVLSGGIPAFAGIPLFGVHDLDAIDGDEWVEPYVLEELGTTPLPSGTPMLRSWYGVPTLPMMSEFTIARSIAESLWTFGVLSAA